MLNIAPLMNAALAKIAGRAGSTASKAKWAAIGIGVLAVGVACFAAAQNTPSVRLSALCSGLGLALASPFLYDLFGVLLGAVDTRHTRAGVRRRFASAALAWQRGGWRGLLEWTAGDMGSSVGRVGIAALGAALIMTAYLMALIEWRALGEFPQWLFPGIALMTPLCYDCLEEAGIRL